MSSPVEWLPWVLGLANRKWVLNSANLGILLPQLIVYMFLREPTSELNTATVYYNVSKPLMTILGITVFATVSSIFFVDPLLEYITHMVQISGY